VTYTQCNKPKKVALTFDDGVSAFTDTLLNTLSNNGVKATFFVIGQNLVGVGQKATLQKMYAAGHNIGSHTYTHPDLTTLTTAQVNSELQQTDALIKSIIGVSPKYFRPPYLAYNGAVDTVVKGYNYTTVMVGLDSNDWQYQATNPELIYSNIVDNFNKSSPIILQHDTYSSSVQLVDRIIKGIQAQSFRIVNMDECLNGA
jgi:peptidoglycan/xylan/chitin deacetylase (PgdA/CDA1 family)